MNSFHNIIAAKCDKLKDFADKDRGVINKHVALRAQTINRW